MPLISIMGFREDGSDFDERYRSAHRRVAGASKRCVAFLFRVGQHAALDLVSFPTCEKRLEIALAETVIALALDVLEKKTAQAALPPNRPAVQISSRTGTSGGGSGIRTHVRGLP